MKFRAVITELPALNEFTRIVNGISKLTKSCVLRITVQKIYFIASGDAVGINRPYVWCELPVPSYFQEYLFCGASEEQNEAYLEFNTSFFCKSLAPLKDNGKSLKMKLTNPDLPCLSFIIEQNVQESGETTNDIPIEVISRELWKNYKEPEFSNFHVSIKLPGFKSIKHVIEKMKIINHALTLNANKSGKLTFTVKSMVAAMSVHFGDLGLESFDVGSSASTLMDQSQAEYVSAKIDARKFLHFLTAMQVGDCSAICSIVQSQMVKLHILKPEVMSLQCFLVEMSDE